MSYADDFGPCFVKNVRISGFDTGIATKFGVNSVVLENITLHGQKKLGWHNNGQAITVRNLVSENSVTVLRQDQWGGFFTLVDARLTGMGAASTVSAIELSAGGMFVRNLISNGYASAIRKDDKAQVETVVGPSVAEWASARLPGSGARSLGLAVKETPDVPWDNPADWAVITDFGAKMDGQSDDSEALQKAIDSGKTTVCIPHGTAAIGKPVIIRGSVRRLIGCETALKFPSTLTGAEEHLHRRRQPRAGAGRGAIRELLLGQSRSGQFHRQSYQTHARSAGVGRRGRHQRPASRWPRHDYQRARQAVRRRRDGPFPSSIRRPHIDALHQS